MLQHPLNLPIEPWTALAKERCYGHTVVGISIFEILPCPLHSHAFTFIAMHYVLPPITFRLIVSFRQRRSCDTPLFSPGYQPASPSSPRPDPKICYCSFAFYDDKVSPLSFYSNEAMLWDT